MTVHDLHPGLDDGTDEDLYRIGTVASLTGIAVERLRAWERRYGLTPAHRVGKTRYYSAAQLARLKKLKQLSDNGHPISSIVELTDAQLQERLGRQRAPAEHTESALRAGLIGPNLLVLEQQALPAQLEICGRWANMAAFCSDQSATGALDTIIVQLPVLLDRHIERVSRLSPTSSVVAVYQFATPTELASVEERGVPTVPWPASWQAIEAAAVAAAAAAPGSRPAAAGRRFSDEELIAIAVSAAEDASGCAQHLVELITRLNAFAEYSEEYAATEAAEPELYEQVHANASLARTQLELALQALTGGSDEG